MILGETPRQFLVERPAIGNAGEIVVAGLVLESSTDCNSVFGIRAITVRVCIATNNRNDGIILDASGGVGLAISPLSITVEQ